MSETAMAGVQLETEPEDDHQQPENGFVSPEATATPGLLTRIDGCVLPFLGGFGKYQRQLIVLTWIPALFIGFSQYSDNFLLAQPNITCVVPVANTTNLSKSHSALFQGPHNSSRSSTRSSFIYANGSYGTRNDSSSMQCHCTEWTFELQTGLVRNVVTKWGLVCNSAWKVHIAKFSLLVGSIFGYLVFGVLADWFGRHPVLIISVLFMLVFGLTVAFSVNVPMFSTLRFFEGFCLAGITLSLFVLRLELCLPDWRFSMTMVASFVVLGGQLLMPGVAYLCRDWQVLQAVIICPLLLMLSYIWIFPESLRWLLATQQYSRSKWIMGHIIKKNQVNTEQDSEQVLQELQGALQKKPKKTCIVKMVGTRNLWKNIVVLCVNSLTGYGIHHCFARSMMDHEAHETTMFHNFYADYYTMAGIAVASCMALCPAVGLMGRRGGLLMFMIITALASLLQLGLLNLLGKYSVQLNIVRSESLNRNFSIAFSIIGMFSSHAVSNLSIFFCAEITPTVIRGGGVGLVLASAGFGMLTAPIMELHNQKGYFLHHIIFACCTLICIICILLLPETRFQPLPETLADGDCYTRQPLLPPPRKPGEQHHLLGASQGSRDYIRVHDTPPPHKAPATVVSTLDSTASSAVDLAAAPSVSNLVAMEVHPGKADGRDPNGHSYCSLPMTPLASSSLDKGSVVRPGQDQRLSSTPLRKKPCVTDPLLSGAGDPGDGVKPSDITVITQLNGKVDPSHGPRAGSPPVPVLKPGPPSPVDARGPPSPLPGDCSPPPPPAAAQPRLGSPLGPPVTLVRGPPAPLHPRPTLLPEAGPEAAAAGPAPPMHDRRSPPRSASPPAPAASPPPPPSPTPAPSPPPHREALVPGAADPQPAEGPTDPLVEADCLPAEEPELPPAPISLPPPPTSSSPLPTRDSPTPPPPIDSVQPPPLESTPPPPPPPPSPPPSYMEAIHDGPPPLSPPPSPPPPPPPLTCTPPPPPPSPPIEAHPAPPADAPAPPPSDPFAPVPSPPVVLPITDIVHASPPEPADVATVTCQGPAGPSPGLLPDPHSVDPAVAETAEQPSTAEEMKKEKEEEEEEEKEEEPVPQIECTVSSPIDLGALPLRDSGSTENNTLNGELSS
ncbi:solute carrier family 22 member 23 [Gadus morhua]|nr:solute carrier family 22 member 23-like [Gadus morhua]